MAIGSIVYSMISWRFVVDGVKRLRREVVLLTDDRNLRVKSLSRDLPVRDLPAFVAWSSSAAATVASN